MTRKEAIEIFKNMLDAWDNYYTIAQSDKKREAVWLAISSLETDEAYQLEYERTTKNDLGVSSELEKNSQKLEKDFGELDCISRVEVIDYLCKHCPDDGECFKDCDEIKHLRQMPSVTPQEPKIVTIAEIKYDKDKLKELVNKAVLTVAPQEPQIFKWCDTCKEYDQEKHCCHRWSKVIRDTVEEMKQEQEPILDKYQAEIDHLHKYIGKLETQITEDSFINKPCVSSGVCEHDKQKILDKIRAEIVERDKKVKAIRSDGCCFFTTEEILEIIDKYKADIESQESEEVDADSN